MEIAYHFISDTLRDGRPIPADGEWLEHTGETVICQSGLHWSRHPLDALKYAPGNTLCLVEVEGIVSEQEDKGVSTRRRIIARLDAEPMLREFARWCALQVIELWDAPEVVRQYLTTGDESMRAAARGAEWAAARGAARGAAQAAAQAAEWAAALGAARAAARGAEWAAAQAAAQAAEWAAALGAARAAAWDAEWDAARAAQRNRFKKMVDAAFEATP